MPSPLLPFLISFALTALCTPLVILLARRMGWVARPREDRWHSKPTALMGGIGIFAGTTAAWAVIAVTTEGQKGGGAGAILPIALPAAAVFLLGAIDDRITLRPHVKLIGQVAAVAAMIVGGVKFEALPPWIGLPLTFLWVVGITNAINLLDNMDGLAAGVAAISAAAMAAYCIGEHGGLGGAAVTAQAAFALAGGCAAFLIFNFKPARIFMGDCGSMFIGFSMAALAVQGTYRSAPNLMLSLLVPVAVLAIPIFDTTLVAIARTLHGRKISQGGRDHSSHRLVALGLSERATVLVLYCLTALFGGLALASTQMRLLGVAAIGVLLLCGLAALGLYLGFLRVYTDEARVPTHVRVLGGILLHKKQYLQVMIDLVLIPVAFVGAHLLRFEGELPGPLTQAVLAAIPAVLAAKLIGLGLCRAYRGVWRYAGLTDALAAGLGSTAGSLLALAAIGLFGGFKAGSTGISRAALCIDWLLFTVLAIGARLGYVALRELFGLVPPKHGPRVIILGAGPEAVPLVQRLRDPHATQRAQVVGILDDDPDKHNRSMNGVRVLGPLDDLPGLLERLDMTCLLGVSPHSRSAGRIMDYCRERGIPVTVDLQEPAHPVEKAAASATA